MKYKDFYLLNEIGFNRPSSDDIVNAALRKFSRADDNAVINFTSTAEKLDAETIENLKYDARLYKWNDHTVRAIYYILAQKNKSEL